jgi:Flp pilus assembly protein TadD
MKAGRAHCLRCLAELPNADAPAPTTMWESLGLSDNNRMLLVGAVALVVLAFVAVISYTRQDDAPDEVVRSVVAQPAPAATAQPAESTPAAAPPEAASGVPAYEPRSFLDSTSSRPAVFTSGDFSSARLAYERTILERPDDAEAWNNLGELLVRLHRVDEAFVRFERAVALAPTKPTYHFNLAQAAAELGHLDKAAGEFRQAAKLFPADYAAQYNLGMALHKKGDDEAAIPEFQKAISSAPGEASFHASLAVSFEKVGRIPEAVQEYRSYLQMAPGAPGADQLKAHVELLSAGLAKPAPAP